MGSTKEELKLDFAWADPNWMSCKAGCAYCAQDTYLGLLVLIGSQV